MADPYSGREQTKAKHFILKRYLQALAFKVLTFSDITYVDGFSGPWETITEDFSDSSFMIAISVLRDAQALVQRRTGHRRQIRCFFSEKNLSAYKRLVEAVAPHHKPEQDFEIKTFCGAFEDAVDTIQTFVGSSFALIFIDPTGWTGYPLERIRPLLASTKCEVLINFMYDFVNRAGSMSDAKTIASLDPILGGPNWEARLNHKLPRGLAIEELFRNALKTAGGFGFVVSTKIDRATADRPHYFIAYASKSRAGLKAFREAEYTALRAHARHRADAKERRRENRSGSADLFAGMDADVQEATIDDVIEEQKAAASRDLIAALERGPITFDIAVATLLQAHMLRETNIKDVCIELAKVGKIENTWGARPRKPSDKDNIVLKISTSYGDV